MMNNQELWEKIRWVGILVFLAGGCMTLSFFGCGSRFSSAFYCILLYKRMFGTYLAVTFAGFVIVLIAKLNLGEFNNRNEDSKDDDES
ncbi:MAG: hypothetical protein H6862_00250 [Rhodospirillales bacterium]|nr:hypothetical protein [Rhodospirillales bacterium]